GAGVRPGGVGAPGAAVGGLVLAGVHQHQVVDHAVRLGEVAVAVGVGDVFEVVVGPREVGLGLGERVDGVDGELSGAERVVGVAGHVLGCASAGRRTVPGLGGRDLEPADGGAGDGVGALGHLLVHLLEREAGDVDAGPAVAGVLQVLADAFGDAPVGVEHLVEVLGAEVLDPEGVVVLVGQGGRVGDVVVQGAVLEGAGRLDHAVVGGAADGA